MKLHTSPRTHTHNPLYAEVCMMANNVIRGILVNTHDIHQYNYMNLYATGLYLEALIIGYCYCEMTFSIRNTILYVPVTSAFWTNTVSLPHTQNISHTYIHTTTQYTCTSLPIKRWASWISGKLRKTVL